MFAIRALAGLLVGASLTACATPAGRVQPVELAATAVSSAAAPSGASVGHAAQPQQRLDLELWRDPAFQRRFTQSYLAETEIEPRLTESDRDALRRVMEFLAADRTADALEVVHESGGPDASAVFDFTLGNIHFENDSLNQAATAYRAAVAKFPKFRRAWRNLALVHTRQSDFESAADGFAMVIELGGGDPVTYGLLGIAHTNLGRDVAAESAFRMALLLDPTTSEWSTGLARSFFNQRRFADAVAHCDAMIAADPERADLWLLQANAYIGMGDATSAAQNYELVDRLGGSTVASLRTLGDIYVNEGLFDEAAGAYARSFALDPGADPADAIRTAQILARRGASAPTERVVAAIETHFGERLDDADRKELLKLRARLALIEGAGEEEVRLLEEVVALDPLDGEALMLLGDHARRGDDAERAIYYYERAAHLEGFEAEAKVRHAQILVKRGDYDDALRLLARAQDLRPLDNVADYMDRVERVARNR